MCLPGGKIFRQRSCHWREREYVSPGVSDVTWEVWGRLNGNDLSDWFSRKMSEKKFANNSDLRVRRAVCFGQMSSGFNRTHDCQSRSDTFLSGIANPSQSGWARAYPLPFTSLNLAPKWYLKGATAICIGEPDWIIQHVLGYCDLYQMVFWTSLSIKLMLRHDWSNTNYSLYPIL